MYDDDISPDKPAAPRDKYSLFLLLLIAAVVGGLYYTLLQARAKTQENERTEVLVAQLTQFPAVVRAAVVRMQANGVPLHDIDFSEDAKGRRAVFNAKGGGVKYRRPPTDMFAEGSYWQFKTVNAEGEGWFIAGAGRDTADGKDVFAYLSAVPQRLCQRINRSLGLGTVPKVEAVAIDLGTPGAADAFAGLNPWTFAAHGRPVEGEETPVKTPPIAACVRNGSTGDYIFYYTLAAQ